MDALACDKSGHFLSLHPIMVKEMHQQFQSNKNIFYWIKKVL